MNNFVCIDLPARMDLSTIPVPVSNGHAPSRLPAGWSGGAYADDGPEVRDVRFSFLPLTDAAPFLVGVAKGFFAGSGLNARVQRSASWTASRDALINGDVHAAHMLYGMPLASRLGILGQDCTPLVIPWVLARNGQAITLGKKYAGQVAADAKALYRIATAKRDAGRPLVFAHTLPPGTHALWLRYWLAAGGLDPDRDVALITIPPPMMVKNMAGGRTDGFCAGEPWNARAAAEGIGFTAITSQTIWPDHPEKVCAFTAAFADKNPRTVKAVLKALHAASVWCDDPANADELAELLAGPDFLNCAADSIRGRLQGGFAYGDGRRADVVPGLTFHARNANQPQTRECLWFLTQYRRWGLVIGEPDYEGIAGSVLRPDLFNETRRELGLPTAKDHHEAVTFFDGGVFQPSQPEVYAQSFTIKSPKG
jgi:nitrate/nitrite transport system substrate-binding protein